MARIAGSGPRDDGADLHTASDRDDTLEAASSPTTTEEDADSEWVHADNGNKNPGTVTASMTTYQDSGMLEVAAPGAKADDGLRSVDPTTPETTDDSESENEDGRVIQYIPGANINMRRLLDLLIAKWGLGGYELGTKRNCYHITAPQVLSPHEIAYCKGRSADSGRGRYRTSY